eukprot:TRINITY_DN8081_c0_g1_i2.p1 TRINITY_DN8081_c0_g1~~TRINITY_DN8081_c0_g1_i2.p1  ORF type:complete len:210 (+),score=51.76 TRINITY_DN8081_c0_g1_i2:396-1025(+)
MPAPGAAVAVDDRAQEAHQRYERCSFNTAWTWTCQLCHLYLGLTIIFTYINLLPASIKHACRAIASVRIQCQPVDGFSLVSTLEQQHDTCVTTRKVVLHTIATSGKVRRWLEKYQVSKDDRLIPLSEDKAASAAQLAQEDPEALLDNLTFNLKLNDKEKEARSQAVLPYTKAAEAAYTVDANPGGGAIFYEPDDVDDFDDEDPDDDLDI